MVFKGGLKKDKQVWLKMQYKHDWKHQLQALFHYKSLSMYAC